MTHTGRVLMGFEFSNANDYRRALMIAAHQPDHRDEEFHYCVLRERGLEMLHCRASGIPFVVFDAEENWLDGNVDLDRLDKDAVRLVLRLSGVAMIREAYLGITPLVSEAERQQVMRWPGWMKSPSDFLKRKVSVVSNAEMKRQLDTNTVPLPCFIKTVNKGPSSATLHQTFHAPEDLACFRQTDAPYAMEFDNPRDAPVSYFYQSPDWYCPYRESTERGQAYWIGVHDDFIVSDVMNVLTDDLAEGAGSRREYRVYLVNGEPVSASRYVDYDVVEVPKSVFEFVEAIDFCYMDKLPPIVVIDVAETDQGLQVVELNPYEHSGRYASNHPGAFFDTLHAEYNKGQSFPFKMPKPVPERPAPNPAIQKLLMSIDR